MSKWATLEAEFYGNRRTTDVREGMPTGSESGPQVIDQDDGSVWVGGRLRDVDDQCDSFRVLAWFVDICRWADTASLVWDLDEGPRYRYRYYENKLTKLHGVLDL
jgi:hypothetical protein